MKKQAHQNSQDYEVEMALLRDRQQTERNKRKDKAILPGVISGLSLGVFLVLFGKGFHLAIPGIPYFYFLFRFFDYWPSLSEDPRIGPHWEYLRTQDMFRQAGNEGRALQLALLLFCPWTIVLIALVF